MKNRQWILPGAFVAAVGLIAAGCGASLQAPGSQLQPTTKIISNSNSSTVVGSPRQTYLRVTQRASKCWFGPFGSAHAMFMTSADVPPPSSVHPVTMKVHRRLTNIKKPWGPVVLRVSLSGQTTTTIEYENVGLDRAVFSRMSAGLTGWANGQSHCPVLLDNQAR